MTFRSSPSKTTLDSYCQISPLLTLVCGERLACLSWQHMVRVYSLYKQGLMKYDIYINVFLWNVISMSEYSVSSDLIPNQADLDRWTITLIDSLILFALISAYHFPECAHCSLQSNHFHVWTLWVSAWRIGVSFQRKHRPSLIPISDQPEKERRRRDEQLLPPPRFYS